VTRQINTHDTTSEPIKRVETDIIRQGVPDVDNTFTEKKIERTQAVV